MPVKTEEPIANTLMMAQAELALMALKKRVASNSKRHTNLERFYRDWQQDFSSRSEQIRIQIDQLQARLAPWMPRETTPTFGVVSYSDEAA